MRKYLFGLGVFAAVLESVRAAVVPGVMGDSFRDALAYSDANQVPFILVWGNVSRGEKCEFCAALETALDSAEAKAWMAERQFVFCHTWGKDKVDDTSRPQDKGAAYFSRTANGTKDPLGKFPFVCAYWPRPDGTVFVDNFEGRSPSGGYMTFAQFKEKVEAMVGDYGRSASFVVGNAAHDRLEAIVGKTSEVAVPVSGFATSAAQTYLLRATYPRSAGTLEQDVVIPAGEAEALPVVTIPTGVAFAAGDVVKLELFAEDEVVSESGITFVDEPVNRSSNPYWVGEKSELEPGDWSMDIDAVKAAVTSGRAKHAVAFFTGALWCPHCQGLEEFVFDTAAFRDWATANGVVFAVFDNPKRSADANPKKPNGAPPTLLRYAAGTNSYDPGVSYSGAAYLSRKGIDPDDAEPILQRNHTLGYPGGEYCAPESARTGYPTFILLNDKTFAPVGRMARLEEATSVSKYYHDPVEHLQRLTDLLLLADRDGEADGYLSTTRLTLAADDSAEMTLQMNDRTRVLKLTGLTESGTLTLTAAKAAGGAVALDYLVDGTVVESGTGTLSVKVKRADLEKTLAVRVNAYPDTTVKLGKSSVCTVGLSSAFEPSPIVDSADLPANFAASVVLEQLDPGGDVKSVSVKRTDGSLPSGLKLKYDKETQAVVLSGTPRKVTAETTFTYTYTITYNDSTKTVSEPVEVTVSVFDPATVNPALGVEQNRTIPLVSGTGDAARIVGTLTVTATTKAKVKAKFAGSKSASFNGSWTSFETDGTAVLQITTKKGESLELTMDTDGLMTATLKNVDGLSEVSGEAFPLTTVGYSAFAGAYTVTLLGDGTEGNGYLTLTMTADAAVKKGNVKFSGLLPDGTTMSGSAQLSGGGFEDVPELGGMVECASLPIFKRTTKGEIAMVLRIRAYGDQTALDEENALAHVVRAYPLAVPTVNGSPVQPYGVWFETGLVLSDWQTLYPRIGDTFELYVAGDRAAVATASGTKITLSEKVGSVSMSYAKKTGVVSGKAQALVGGALVSGTWKGVILPGWHYDCGCGGDDPALPFGIGTFYYTDKSSGKSVKSSLPVTVEIVGK